MADTLIQLRTDTAENWTTYNPVLYLGEPGFESDTGKMKMGDGVTVWNSLGYIEGTPGFPDGRPYFTARKSATQSAPTKGVYTKVQFDAEEEDSDNCYDTTNYRFTPNVAGRYLITASIVANTGSGAKRVFALIYKNGSEVVAGNRVYLNNDGIVQVTGIVTANGSTDYFEIYTMQLDNTGTIDNTPGRMIFQGQRISS